MERPDWVVQPPVAGDMVESILSGSLAAQYLVCGPPFQSALPSIRTLEMPPIERTETIPASWYVDDRFHAFDREVLFNRHWQYVGPVADVEAPGGYLQVDVAGNPVVIVRDKDNAIRRFYNVCCHRGGPLVMDDCGHTNVLQCKYHGWTYRLDGSLRGVPKFDRAELCDVLSYRNYVTETYAHYSLQHSPLNEAADDNPYSTDGAAFYYFVFPNIMLNILPGRLQMNAVTPLAPDRTRVVFDYFYDTTDTVEAQQRVERDVAFSDRVQPEDITICEHVQRGLQSRAYDRGRFSVEMEEGVYHFQQLLKRAYRGAAPS